MNHKTVDYLKKPTLLKKNFTFFSRKANETGNKILWFPYKWKWPYGLAIVSFLSYYYLNSRSSSVTMYTLKFKREEKKLEKNVWTIFLDRSLEENKDIGGYEFTHTHRNII